MSLKLGDLAPNFSAQTTLGVIDFHQWLGDRWGVLFSHPRNFTPVCTTELGTLAGLKCEFERRGVKVIGLSVDGVDDQSTRCNSPLRTRWPPRPTGHRVRT